MRAMLRLAISSVRGTKMIEERSVPADDERLRVTHRFSTRANACR